MIRSILLAGIVLPVFAAETGDGAAPKLTVAEMVELAKKELAIANDESLDLEVRKTAYLNADKHRKDAKVGWKKVGEVPAFAAEIDSTPPTVAAPANPAAPNGRKKAEPEQPKGPFYIHFQNAIQLALFKEVIHAEIAKEGGRWYSANPKGHYVPFVEIVASVEPDDLGISFTARKTNYNVNDSNWVNQPAVFERLMAVANAARPEGTPAIVKKHMTEELVNIKRIFGMRCKNVPEQSEVIQAPAAAVGAPAEPEHA